MVVHRSSPSRSSVFSHRHHHSVASIITLVLPPILYVINQKANFSHICIDPTVYYEQCGFIVPIAVRSVEDRSTYLTPAAVAVLLFTVPIGTSLLLDRQLSVVSESSLISSTTFIKISTLPTPTPQPHSKPPGLFVSLRSQIDSPDQFPRQHLQARSPVLTLPYSLLMHPERHDWPLHPRSNQDASHILPSISTSSILHPSSFGG